MSDAIRPFELHVDQVQLDDLRRRLATTRWIESETVTDWSQGVPLDYLKELCEYWQLQYNWRDVESRLNSIGQFVTNIDGLDIHFLSVTSPRVDATPLLITHGWPGSVIEFLDVIGPLSDPDLHGAPGARAFHVVCPSLPGYGFSDKPMDVGWDVSRIADAWATLMQRLGYEKFIAQGGDWGAGVSTSLAVRHPQRLLGLHLTMPIAVPTSLDPEILTAEEKVSLSAMGAFRLAESAYSAQQSTRPQTLGYSLVDSPVGLAAWIVEKFHAWSDCEGSIESVMSRDAVLDNVTLYWLTASGGSSARLYWESFAKNDFTPTPVPTGCSLFPKEIYRPSRRWVEARYSNLIYWNEPLRGGHFAAFEQPDIFVSELRAFGRALSL